MPLTMIDAAVALIVIDLQNGIVGLPTAHPVGEVVARARSLADAFRERDLPVVLVNVAGVPPGRTEQAQFRGELASDFADLVPELGQTSNDHLVTKRTAGAFTRTDLEAFLQARGVTQVVIVGIATSRGVESTARQAHEFGFNVTLATDAITDLDADLHAIVTDKIFPRLGETGTTAEVLALLLAR